MTKQCGEIIVECDERDAERLKQVAELTKENERLEGAVKQYEEERKYHFEMSRNRVAETKADTIRKMQERLSEQFHDRVAYTRSYVHDTIDQIAKEMLEGEK